MNIAIFQGISEYHYDHIGYVIEYVVQRKPTSKLSLFVHFNHHSDDYVKFYKKLYGETFDVKHINEFNVNNFDCTFLVTDDDQFFPHNISMNKVIVINHDARVRRYDGIYFISTRNMPTPFPWALTHFQYIDYNTKLKYISDVQNPVISCLGLGGTAPLEFYMSLLERFPDITINVIGRHANVPTTDRLKCYRNVPVEVVYEVCSKSTHMLCYSMVKPFDKLMSGSVAVAFCTGCQLIMPEIYNYDFESKIYYNSVDDIKIPSVQDFKDNILSIVYKDQKRLTDDRNRVFDETI